MKSERRSPPSETPPTASRDDHRLMPLGHSTASTLSGCAPYPAAAVHTPHHTAAKRPRSDTFASVASPRYVANALPRSPPPTFSTSDLPVVYGAAPVKLRPAHRTIESYADSYAHFSTSLYNSLSARLDTRYEEQVKVGHARVHIAVDITELSGSTCYIK